MVAGQFGRNLTYCRKRAKLSREELAVRASLHRTAVGQLERGERVARVTPWSSSPVPSASIPESCSTGWAGTRGEPRIGSSRPRTTSPLGSRHLPVRMPSWRLRLRSLTWLSARSLNRRSAL